MRKMPIGIQDFDGLITDGFVYVDKTEWVYKLANEGVYYFLGRPRRFGKSLLLSSLKAYFEGKKELFKGLAIEGFEQEWESYPVLHIDLSIFSYKNVEDLNVGLDANLRRFEKVWISDVQDAERAANKAPAIRFYDLIQTAYERTGRKVVVLVDEYDRPLTQTMERSEVNDEIRDALKGFYGVLKGAGSWLRFVMLTGVTKFSKVSVFSDLNMLRDISMSKQYAGVCGISARELEENFGPELAALAETNDMTYEEALAEMKKRYDGYRFSETGESMYNPFSVLNTFADKKFSYYWFATGTPTFLVEQIKKADFDPLLFAKDVTIEAEAISDYRMGGGNPVPLLYQSGYLTITGYDKKLNRYVLGFPNEEVRYGFLKELLPYYTYSPKGTDFSVAEFIDDLNAGDADGFMTRMRSFFANIPYDLSKKYERYYQLVFYLVFTLIGRYTQAELHSHKGRSDMVVYMQDAVYVFEFKLNGTAEEALQQIDEKGYAIPYEAGNRKVVKIGAAFDKDERNIARWLVRDSD